MAQHLGGWGAQSTAVPAAAAAPPPPEQPTQGHQHVPRGRREPKRGGRSLKRGGQDRFGGPQWICIVGAVCFLTGFSPYNPSK